MKRSSFLSWAKIGSQLFRRKCARLIPTKIPRSSSFQCPMAYANICTGWPTVAAEHDCFKQSSLRMVAAFAFADQVNTDSDRMRDCGYGNNLHGETQRARNVDDRIDRKKNRGQRDAGAANRGDSQPDRRTGTNRTGTKNRNRQHHEVNDPK